MRERINVDWKWKWNGIYAGDLVRRERKQASFEVWQPNGEEWPRDPSARIDIQRTTWQAAAAHPSGLSFHLSMYCVLIPPP